jgi:hypothetical protein
MFFLHDVTETSNSASSEAQNAPSDGEGMLDEDYDDFGSISSGELVDEDPHESSSPRPHDDQPSIIELAPSAFGLLSVDDGADFIPIVPNTADDERKLPCTKSMAHFDLVDSNIVFLSLDLETGGEYYGIIQLSGQIFRHNLADPQQTTFLHVSEKFNEYVRPPDGVFWNEEARRQSH